MCMPPICHCMMISFVTHLTSVVIESLTDADRSLGRRLGDLAGTERQVTCHMLCRSRFTHYFNFKHSNYRFSMFTYGE